MEDKYFIIILFIVIYAFSTIFFGFISYKNKNSKKVLFAEILLIFSMVTLKAGYAYFTQSNLSDEILLLAYGLVATPIIGFKISQSFLKKTK